MMARHKNLQILSTRIIDGAGDSTQVVHDGENYIIEIQTTAATPMKNVSVGYNIKTEAGFPVYGTSTAVQGVFVDFAEGDVKTTRFTFQSKLGLGKYYLSAGAAESLTPEDEIHNYVMQDFVHDAVPFVATSKAKGFANLNSKLVSLKKIPKL
jgi:hypothetical protein